MSKRGRGDTLTGGSKDVNPQTLIMGPVVQTGNDAATGIGVAMPIPRLPISKGRSLVIELLAVDTYILGTGFLANTVTTQTVVVTTNPTVLANEQAAFQDPRTITGVWREIVANAAPTSFGVYEKTKHIDMTDQAGHGILIATDQLYLVFYSTNTGGANTGSARLTYRFKDVSLEEYIGIVQSQQ
jgi:hypothetical protein